MRPLRLWVTRTQPQAEATAARLRALGHEPVVAPVLEVRPVAVDPARLAGADALAFTSQAAVAAFAAQSPERGLPVFAVGEATAAAARAAGFSRVAPPAAGGDVRALADQIAQAAPRPAALLNPTARAPAADLAALLAERGIPARGLVIYETAPTPMAGAPVGIDGVLIHSARAAEQVAQGITPALAASLSVYALSEAAASGLRNLGFARILVAEHPDEAALLRCLADEPEPSEPRPATP